MENIDTINVGNDIYINNFLEGIIITDKNGKIEEYNRDIFEILNEKKVYKNIYIYNLLPGIDFKKNIQMYYKGVKGIVIKRSVLDNKIIFIVNEICYESLIEYIYSNIMDFVEDGITIINKEREICYYNKVMEIIEGYNQKQIIGMKIEEVYSSVDSDSIILLQSLKTKKPVRNCYQKLFLNNRWINLLINSIPIMFNEELVGVVAIMKDYTKYSNMLEKNIELQQKLSKQTITVNNEKISAYFKFSQIVGKNKVFLEQVEKAKRAALSDSSVMVYGETGTGKELFAQSIHSYSTRSNKPFIAINCAAIPETLFEGLLFGTTKGAYTNSENKPGLFEQADKGTLFLDEINSMPIFLQAKLLRVLENKKVRRLGSRKEIDIDVRIISACNIPVMESIREGYLRTDLFYRLAVICLEVPPLRKRKKDIELLTNYYINIYNQKLFKNILGLSPKVLKAFEKFDWPGNVRQLKHCVESSMTMIENSGKYISMQHIPEYLRVLLVSTDINYSKEEVSFQISTIKELKEYEKLLIANTLNENNGNITKSAKKLGVSRQSLQNRLKRDESIKVLLK